MKLYLTMTGVPELRRAFANVTPEIERALGNAVRETALEIVAGAKARVHVRTGELRNTIRAEVRADGMVAYVKAGFGTLKRRSRAKVGSKRRRSKQLGPTEPGIYAMVVEFGSTKQPAHPFLFPALEAARAGFQARAEAALDPAIESAVRNAGASA